IPQHIAPNDRGRSRGRDGQSFTTFTSGWNQIVALAAPYMNVRFQQDIPRLAEEVEEVHEIVNSLIEVCRDNMQELERELPVLETLHMGIRHTMSYKQPQLVALFIYDQIQGATRADGGVDLAAVYKAVADIRKTSSSTAGFPEYSAWGQEAISRKAAPRPGTRRGGGAAGGAGGHHGSAGNGGYSHGGTTRPPTPLRTGPRAGGEGARDKPAPPTVNSTGEGREA
ncbi:unnamed protein product, partial [Pylaiella littoralis]